VALTGEALVKLVLTDDSIRWGIGFGWNLFSLPAYSVYISLDPTVIQPYRSQETEVSPKVMCTARTYKYLHIQRIYVIKSLRRIHPPTFQ
jgi:hypothetical protein